VKCWGKYNLKISPTTSKHNHFLTTQMALPAALIFLFRGHPTLRSQFYCYSCSYPIFEQPIFGRAELCSVISQDISNLMQFAGNRIKRRQPPIGDLPPLLRFCEAKRRGQSMQIIEA